MSQQLAEALPFLLALCSVGHAKAGTDIEKSKAEDGTTVYRIAAGAEGGK